MAGDRGQRLLAVLDLDGSTGLHSTVAVTVADDFGAAAFDQLGELGVVVLGAGQNDLAAERTLLVGLAGLELFGRFLEHREDQFLRADQRAELDDLELIARDGRVIELAVIADLVDDRADLVVQVNGLHKGFVGDVDAEFLVQRIEDVGLQLAFVVLNAVLVSLERHVGERHEEVRILDDVHVAKMLLETAGDRAGLSAEISIQEVVAAFECALEEAAAVMAGTAGHVICSHVRRSAFRRSQTDCKAAGQVEQNFGHEVAGVTQRSLAVCLSLPDQLVVGLLEQVFKCDQVFQVSHVQAPLKFFAFNNRLCMI